MRVVVAPDSFGGTLSAAEAAAAIASGWSGADDLVLVPLSDGGPGFLEAAPGDLVPVVVEGPLARPVPAAFRLHGTTAYVESAAACGLHLLREAERDPAVTTTYGVGQLVAAAVAAGAGEVVVGLGGSATNDGGAGCLAALGLSRHDAAGERLAPGGLALREAALLAGQLDLALRVPAAVGPEARPVPVRLVAATDVDAPLLGPHGATRVYARQKGGTDLDVLEAAVSSWADVLEGHLGVRVRDLPGAGAAGGLGFALLAAGARRVSGAALVADLAGLPAALQGADLVITGEGTLDATSLTGKVVSQVAAAAQVDGIPCLALAGQVAAGRRELQAAGVEAGYSVADLVGLPAALADPAGSLSALARSVSREWSR